MKEEPPQLNQIKVGNPSSPPQQFAACERTETNWWQLAAPHRRVTCSGTRTSTAPDEEGSPWERGPLQPACTYQQPCKWAPGPSYSASFGPQGFALWGSHQGECGVHHSAKHTSDLLWSLLGKRGDENKCKACLWSWKQQSGNTSAKHKAWAPWLTISVISVRCKPSDIPR